MQNIPIYYEVAVGYVRACAQGASNINKWSVWWVTWPGMLYSTDHSYRKVRIDTPLLCFTLQNKRAPLVALPRTRTRIPWRDQIDPHAEPGDMKTKQGRLKSLSVPLVRDVRKGWDVYIPLICSMYVGNLKPTRSSPPPPQKKKLAMLDAIALLDVEDACLLATEACAQTPLTCALS